MTILIRVIQLILSLSLLVMIHEFGHFVFARLNGVRVSKFYMFFNPQISLVRMKKINGKWQVRFFAKNVKEFQKVALDAHGDPLLWEDDPDENVRKKWAKKDEMTEAEWEEIERDFNFGRSLRHKGHPKFTIIEEEDLPLLDDADWRKYPETTEWGLGWLPLGGYCAIAGMVDETTSADQLGSEPKEWEYRAKKTWQRLPIICGGVLVNFIGAFVIYSAILGHWGTDTLPLRNATYGFEYSEELRNEGLQSGDLIVRVGDKTPETVKDLLNWMVIEGEHDLLILRGHDTIPMTLSDNFDQKVLAAGGSSFISFRFPFVVDSVMPNTPAALAAIPLQAGDSIVTINGVVTPCYQDVVAKLDLLAGDSVTLGVVRQGEQMDLSLLLDENGKMGVFPRSIYDFLRLEHRDYGFFEAIPAGIAYGCETLVNYVKQFRLVFTPQGAKSLGGFGSIGSLFPPMWDWHAFWLMTAFLSVILGFMNIIPIPGLDGGHVMFLLWEMVTGKKPSDKFIEIANNIGFYLLLALLIFANGNDILKLFIK
ncbi:MAG: RIP metalloprotease RseP [Paludibacteraceae bacterium]|nr:RIP metalloprotease RseP [Paludibacteraceae bacterium]